MDVGFKRLFLRESIVNIAAIGEVVLLFKINSLICYARAWLGLHGFLSVFRILSLFWTKSLS